MQTSQSTRSAYAAHLAVVALDGQTLDDSGREAPPPVQRLPRVDTS